jgi:hypothetical protein
MPRPAGHIRPFRAPGASFLPPISEPASAADRLDRAAEAVLRGAMDAARALIAACDLPALNTCRALIVEGAKPDIRRYRSIPDAPSRHRGAAARMPSRRTALDIFRRDGGCCRFCGIRILARDAIRLLDSLFPGQLRRKAKPCRNRKAAFFVLASSFDHILPHSRGGWERSGKPGRGPREPPVRARAIFAGRGGLPRSRIATTGRGSVGWTGTSAAPQPVLTGRPCLSSNGQTAVRGRKG